MASLENISKESDVNELWSLYKVAHNRTYSSDQDVERFEIFKESVKKIIEHNDKFAKGEVTFTMGINHFADKKPEERPGYRPKH